jgi:hypothetical protein
MTTPGGLALTMSERRRVALANAADPLSLTSQTDSVALNGQWTVGTYTQATRALVQTSPEGRQIFGRLDAKGRLIKSQAEGLDSIAFASNTSATGPRRYSRRSHCHHLARTPPRQRVSADTPKSHQPEPHRSGHSRRYSYRPGVNHKDEDATSCFRTPGVRPWRQGPLRTSPFLC